jgi:hypothetical protein
MVRASDVHGPRSSASASRDSPMLVAAGGYIFRDAVGGGQRRPPSTCEHGLSNVGGRGLPPCQIAIERRDIHSVALILVATSRFPLILHFYMIC